MIWFSLYHDYFILKAKHFLFPALVILPTDFFFNLHIPSALISQLLFNMVHGTAIRV